ncbi:MAG: type II toxin-antitoxin system RelE/ParE family toxin [Clostridiales bacterium]|jgi:plasmid stabilization system protein ParE|nr:type II toxin-antitoxin system RelE/ParE family toxin [Clostridiales bacterium]
MAYTVKSSNEAKADKRNIVTYLSKFSVNAPIRFKQELTRYSKMLVQTPHIFAVFQAKPKYRHVVIFGSYAMFYTVDEATKTVLIYRIIHGARDTDNIL